jgi:hypothetical protein
MKVSPVRTRAFLPELFLRLLLRVFPRHLSFFSEQEISIRPGLMLTPTPDWCPGTRNDTMPKSLGGDAGTPDIHLTGWAINPDKTNRYVLRGVL